MTPTSFDGCGRRCRNAFAHTMVYGECELAPPPEPTVSMSRIFTDGDGRPSIGFDVFTVQQLADLIEPAFRASDIEVSADHFADLAREAAHAIVHRGDQPNVEVEHG